MDRSVLHGAPPQGRAPTPRGPFGLAQSMYGSQDARGNLAIQPATNTGSFKLKKKAVKIVGVAAPSTPFPATSTVSEPVKAEPKEAERQQPIDLAATPAPPKPATSEAKLTTSSTGEEAALDELFARLSTQGAHQVTHKIKKELPAGPDIKLFPFEKVQNAQDSPIRVSEILAAKPPVTSVGVDEAPSEVTAVSTQHVENKSQVGLEQQYLGKALEYLLALPDGGSVSVKTIKAASKKLRSTYATEAKPDNEDSVKLKARYALAIVNYINKVYKNSAQPITPVLAQKALRDSEGNLLTLYGKLVDEDYLPLDNLDNILGLSKYLLDVLPKAELTGTSTGTVERNDLSAKTEFEPCANTTTDESKSVSKDPIDSMKAWPAQEKRENPPAYRTCILKGVTNVKSINQLQALVWGGRLESISMPSPGSDFAIIRFLTPEACEKYFKATENGIELEGDKKSVIFVEKQSSPTSINDVMRNCADGDVSRCVRALDAEADWSDMVLMKLARGKGASKREVDRIKQGKTARGRHYVEFRFATIYHALSFKRQLAEDPDWEPCTINYAADPCETAQGVHYKDANE